MAHHSPTRDPATGTVEFAGDLYAADAWAWVCEARDRSHLDKVRRADKNGVMRTLYVKKAKAATAKAPPKPAAPAPTPAKTPAPKADPPADHAATISADLGDPARLTPGRLKSLPADLAKLSVPQLEALNVTHQAGGDAKAHLIAKLTAHAKAKAPPPPPKPPAPPLAGKAKEAADHLSTLVDGFAGGGTPKAAVDAGLARLAGLGRSDLMGVARHLHADAGLKPDASRPAIVRHLAARVNRVWKTADNVRH